MSTFILLNSRVSCNLTTSDYEFNRCYRPNILILYLLLKLFLTDTRDRDEWFFIIFRLLCVSGFSVCHVARLFTFILFVVIQLVTAKSQIHLLLAKCVFSTPAFHRGLVPFSAYCFCYFVWELPGFLWLLWHICFHWQITLIVNRGCNSRESAAPGDIYWALAGDTVVISFAEKPIQFSLKPLK